MILMTVKYFVSDGEIENVLSRLRVYADDAALQAHRETPHFKEILERRVVPLLTNRVREFYELQIQ